MVGDSRLASDTFNAMDTILHRILPSALFSVSPSFVLAIAIPLVLPVLWYFLKPPRVPGIPNATPMLPLIGNAISYGIDPVQFLLRQRQKHGDVFLVNLAIFKVVFFLGPEGTNAIFKGTERSGISFYASLEFLMGAPVTKGTSLFSVLETVVTLYCISDQTN